MEISISTTITPPIGAATVPALTLVVPPKSVVDSAKQAKV